jgi:flagellar basal body-associated protein FliL
MASFQETAAGAKRTAKKILRTILAVIILIFVGVMLFVYFATYSSGVRAGIVLKVSKRGAIFKTYEGQLDIMSFGAIKKSENQFSQTFEFSVYKSHEGLIKDLEQAALNGTRVNLRYEEKYAILPWRGETKYFITEVERLPSKPDGQKEKEAFPR